MRDNLDGLTQIVTPAFLVNYTLVDTAGSNVVGFGGLDTQESFIVSQVEVGFVPVYGYVAFSVFIRVQSSRIDVDIRVKLLDGYAVASGLQQLTDR